jgi:hypothetical protein
MTYIMLSSFVFACVYYARVHAFTCASLCMCVLGNTTMYGVHKKGLCRFSNTLGVAPTDVTRNFKGEAAPSRNMQCAYVLMYSLNGGCIHRVPTPHPETAQFISRQGCNQ